MSEATILWLVLAGILVIAELMSGTFYLLMLAIGAAAGALAARFNLDSSGQVGVAAWVAFTLVAAWYVYRLRRPVPHSQDLLHSMNMDIGSTLHVDTWRPDGSATVKYRGAPWNVILRHGQPAMAGEYRVVELDGNSLVVEKSTNT